MDRQNSVRKCTTWTCGTWIRVRRRRTSCLLSDISLSIGTGVAMAFCMLCSRNYTNYFGGTLSINLSWAAGVWAWLWHFACYVQGTTPTALEGRSQ
jgi:hypothetical protein